MPPAASSDGGQQPVEIHGPGVPDAVYEEGRGSPDSGTLPTEAILLDAPGVVVVRQILLEPPQVEPELGRVAHEIFIAQFVLILVEEVVHLPEAPLGGGRLRGQGGTSGTGMHRVEGEVPKDEAHPHVCPFLQLL